MKTSSLVKGLAIVATLAALTWGVVQGFAAHAAYHRAAGKAECEGQQAKATSTALVAQKKDNGKQLARQAATGAQREAARSAIDDYFLTLEGQAHEATISTVDSPVCHLPAERLRQWAAANAGRAGAPAPPSAAAGQPDASAAEPAAAQERGDARSRGQSSASGAPVSPAGQPALPAAGLPASSP